MTYRQYGTMRYISGHEIGTEFIKRFNLTTFGSLLQRGWIRRVGDSIELTKKGNEAFEQYTRALPNYRKVEGEISERVRLMLALNRTKGAA